MGGLRYTLRTLRRAPSFTCAAIMTLALGMAVNTIAFTLLNSLALRPMPVREPGQVVRVYPIDLRGHRQNLFSYPDFLDYKASATGFEGLAAYIPASLTVQIGNAEAEDVIGYVVSPDYLPLLGIQPSLGRVFSPEDRSSRSTRCAANRPKATAPTERAGAGEQRRLLVADCRSSIVGWRLRLRTAD